MTRTPLRLALALAVAALAVIVPASAVPAQEDQAPPAPTESTFAPGTEPAVVVSDGDAAGDEPAWTFRYLVPTLAVLTLLALAAVALGYGVRVKGRYRVAR